MYKLMKHRKREISRKRERERICTETRKEE
jgi:hypothetical protein